jgi:hypothetical protein
LQSAVEKHLLLNFTISSVSYSSKGINMSRHKIVKNMDLDDELDDFDGGEDYDDDGGDNGLLPL